MQWVYLVTAPDQLTAEMWRDLLTQEGIPAMVRPGDVASYLGTSFMPCRLLVDEKRREEALTLLEGRLGREL